MNSHKIDDFFRVVFASYPKDTRDLLPDCYFFDIINPNGYCLSPIGLLRKSLSKPLPAVGNIIKIIAEDLPKFAIYIAKCPIILQKDYGKGCILHYSLQFLPTQTSSGRACSTGKAL